LAPQHLVVVLRSVFLLLLLCGVVGGLSGQAVAEPKPPCAHMAMAQSAAIVGMADCCPDKGKSSNDSGPCKGMANACLAMAGCTTSALNYEAYLPLRAVAGKDHSWFRQNIPALYGRSIPPDPYPPSDFG
jgi:hypothetical protein